MKYRENAPSGKNYQELLRLYIENIASLQLNKNISERRLEHQFECLRDWSLFHDDTFIKEWFLDKRKNCQMHVEEIPLNKVKDWSIDPQTGNIQHNSGEFFHIHGIRITQSTDREVGVNGWDQPIITQVGYDGGLLGILCQRFDGIPHYLIEAKAEPGNYEKLQLSPTLQATFSNLKKAHKGRKPHFADYFENPENRHATVLYKQWLSEDGGRLYLKRNMGMLIEVPSDQELDIPDNFIWMSMYQIKSLLLENAWINPHIRGIISHL